MSRRMERVNVLVRQKLSEIISRDMKDPRLSPVITVTGVEVSSDFGHAKVFTSVMGSPEESISVIGALNSASGFLRRELRNQISLRNIPHLVFIADDSLVKAERLIQMINDVRAQDVSQENI